MKTRYRLALVAVLLVVLFGLMVHHGGTSDREWPSHPDARTIAEDPAAYDGERILLFGRVKSVDDEADRLVMVSQGTLEVEVREFEKDVEPGGVVQVYGELSQESSVQHADSTVVVNHDAGAEQYKLAVSALAGVVPAGLFLWYWRINWRDLSFEVRNG